MNRNIITLLTFGLLILFIFSPFAAFAGLMLVLFIAALFTAFGNILQVAIGDTDKNQN